MTWTFSPANGVLFWWAVVWLIIVIVCLLDELTRWRRHHR